MVREWQVERGRLVTLERVRERVVSWWLRECFIMGREGGGYGQ